VTERAANSAEPDRPIRWGFIATGHIARAFAEDLALLPDAELVAIGSRDGRSADAFGDEFDVPNRHGSYQALAEDPEVDVVYVATPHPGHHDAALRAIRAGKAVLVEKPFTMDAGQAEELIAAARSGGTFLMEAMWTRFLPDMVRLREILAQGMLGQIITLTAEHGQWFERDGEFRLFKPELGGGALLDLGIYPVSFASMVLGTPKAVTAVSDPAFTGVDAQTSMIFQYEGGAHAVLSTTSYAVTGNAAAINGTEARLELAGTFYRPTSLRVIDRAGGELERYDLESDDNPEGGNLDGDDAPERQSNEVEGNGLRFEAAEVGRCLRADLTESPIMTLDETLSIMKTMDEVRRQIGLTY
jgi:predicted dehydrogenase